MLIKPLNRWIKTTFNGVPLRTLLIVPFFLQILGTVGIVGYLSYRSGQQVVEELTNQLITEIGDRITQNLDDYLHTSIDITQINAKSISSGLLDWQNKLQLEDYFVDQINTFSQVSSIYIATEQKDFLVVAKPQSESLVIREWNRRTGNLENYVADLQGNRLYLRNIIPNYDPHNDPPSQPWYPIAKAAKNGTWQTVTSGVKKSNLILVLVHSLPFYDSQGNFKGVVGATVFLDKMSEFLGQLKIGKTGQAFIMDNRGYLIATSTHELPFQVTDFSPKLETSDPQKWRLFVEDSRDPVTQTVGKYVRSKFDNLNSINHRAVKLRVQGQNQRYCIRVIPYSLDEDYNWFIVVTVPESDFIKTIKINIYRAVLLWCFIAFLLNFLAARFASKHIVKPIIKLNLAAQELAQNNLEHLLEKTSIKEVNQLTDSFSQMAEQLNSSFQALKLSERRFSVLLDSVPIGVSVFDSTGQHILINKLGQQILGQGIKIISPEQLSEVYQVYIAGTNQLYPVEQLPGIKALKGEKVHVEDIEIEVQGRRIPLEVTSIPVFDESGTVIYSVIMFQDITERRQNEQLRRSYQQQLEQEIAERTLKLQQNQERLKLVIDATRDGIWDWDIINNTAWWSPQFYHLLGLSVVEIQPDPIAQFSNLVHPDDRHHFQQAVTNHLENNHPYILELRVQQADGSYGWFLIKGQALRYPDGQPYRMVGSFSNINDRKQIEEQLRKTEQWLQQYSRQSPSSIYTLVLEPDGRLWFEYTSSAVESIHEVTQAQALKNANLVIDQMHPDDRAGYLAAATRSAESLELFSHEWRIITPTGKLKWLHATSKPERRSNGAIAWHGVIQDISDRKQVQEALHQSEERFQELAAASPGVIYSVIEYPSGPVCYEYLSPAFEDIHEIPVESVLEDASITFKQIYPDDRDGYQQALKESLETGKPFKYEWRIITPSGKIKWIQANSRPQRRENGEIAWHGIVQDISDRKQAEELLHQSEARYLSILEHQTELVTRFQPDGRLSYVNEAFCRYYGVSREEAIGHCYKPRIYPEDQPIIDRCLTQLSPQKPVGIVEHRVIVNGEVRWMQWTNQAIYDTEGNLVELQSVGRDIDDLKRTEELLHQSEARYLSILEYQTEFITRFKADGTLSYVNDAYCRYFGISKEYFLGHHYQPIIYPEDQLAIDRCLAQLSPEQPVFNIENRVIVNGEARWTQWTNQAIYDTQGNLVELQSVGRDIHDRKKAEFALQKTTEQLQAFLDNAPAIIHLFDAEGRYLQVNRAFLKLFNLPEQQIIGRTFADFFPEDVVNLFNTRVEELIERGEPLIIEDELVINGECKSFQSILFPVKNEGVPPQTFWSIVTDISERKQAELELRQSRDLRDAIFHESADALFLVDSDSLLTIDCNRRAIELFEVQNREELIGIEGHTLQKRLFTPAEMDKINQDIEQKGMWSLEVEYISKTGRHFWGNLAVKQVEIVGQRLNLVRVTDISERKFAEQALSESEKQLRLLADALPVFISYADCDERYQFVNQKYEEEFGMSREEICGKTTLEVIGEVNYHLVRGYIQQALAGESVSYEVTIPGSETSEERHLSVMLIPNFDEDLQVRGYYSLIIDISDRKRMELELQKAKETAEAASQAKGAFIANMSHELRSPLNAILGFARILKNDPQLSSEPRKNADIIYRSGEHLLNLINQVLDLAKIEANRTTLDPKDFNLDKLLEDIYSMFSLKVESKGLHLNIQKNPDVPRYIRTDEIKLRQVLINLLSNALKFTNHGSITLRVFVASPSSDDNIILNFEVEDTGVGIAPAEKTHLFEAFSQTSAGRKIQEGTGLGLTISREFVKLMGGKISVESQLNIGSLFRFNIAAKIVDAVLPTSPVSEQKIIGLAPGEPLYRLLVADDNFANRRLLVQLLTPLGFAVQEAENGEEALTCWQQWQPDLIWMDLRMPVLDGWEATKQIRHLEHCQNTTNPVKIIAVSANRLSHYETLGFNNFIHKPFEELEIFTALQQHLGVKYSYAKNVPETSEKPVNTANWVEAIANLPPPVLQKLEEALILGDPQLIQQIIQSVEKENSNLAAVLTPLADQFEYGRILDLIRSVRSVR
ncbi:PAS domain S-box protein [Capilliphycus salinus ALCB114379]|uniref:PAS domain S-box protein n=1 Tax=Capilliphycus salinus TaxID=2768948 RepID=UPI0039A448A4